MADNGIFSLRPQPLVERRSTPPTPFTIYSGDYSPYPKFVSTTRFPATPQHDETDIEERPINRVEVQIRSVCALPNGDESLEGTQTLFRASPDELGPEYQGFLDDEDEDGIDADPIPMSQSKHVVVEIPISTLTSPRSSYNGFVLPAPQGNEREVVSILLGALKNQEPEVGDFVEFYLSDFTVYVDQAHHPNQLRGLQDLATRAASDRFYFDGILHVGQTKFFLQKKPFRELPIGNYGISEHTVGDQMWIRSELNQGKEIYYKLGKPSVEYERFHMPFLWIVDLAKHVVDYCAHLHGQHRRAVLYDFRSRFSVFLFSKHRKSAAFGTWNSAFGQTDFRAAIIANIDFIWKEAVGVLGHENTSRHHFWAEIKGGFYKPNLGTMATAATSDGESDRDAPEKGPTRHKQDVPKTIVTPYISRIFGHMGLETIIRPVEPVSKTALKQFHQISNTGLAEQSFHRGIDRSKKGQKRDFIDSIQLGDVISTPPDDEGTGTKWKRETSTHHRSDYVWYALVLEIHTTKSGHRSFDVLWMYEPRDTPCALMKYPWAKELFLSDSCTCGGTSIDENDVLATHRIDWFGQPSSSPTADFFVRQTYLAGERCWVSLKIDHMKCPHHRVAKCPSRPSYRAGDTVLAKGTQPHLQAFVVETIFREEGRKWARLRRLLRRRDVENVDCPANELVYSNELVEMQIKRISRPCLVRVYRQDEKIPAPYDRNGTGDAFFITRLEVEDNGNVQYLPVEDPTSLKLRQGFDPSRIPNSEKLRGLDLFCGGGNFGRGLEDGGAIQMNWANDIAPNAIHTYMANCEPGTCKPYLGSIDNLLYRALQGKTDVPQPGEVQFISGGSPCQGFSRLTINHDTMRQLKNRSMVASFASFIDLYRPEYGLLENVLPMVKGPHGGSRHQCFFSQLVCAIVGMGYQVRIIYADAWSFGSPQSRCRIFLCFAAPGVQIPNPPAPSHSHPPGTKMGKVGLMSNGQSFGERVNIPTPFKFVSASDAVSDLPDIRDGKPGYCVKFPDHRLSIGYTLNLMSQLRHVPMHPFHMNFDKAYFGYEDEEGNRVTGVLSDIDRNHIFPEAREIRTQKGTKGWGRMHPHRLFGTVCCVCGPRDVRMGNINHWNQPRPMSVQEVRRAQGFQDCDLLLGKPAAQWHTVGNSVARQVAMALGLAIHEAWLGTLYDNDSRKQLIAEPIGPPGHTVDFRDLHADLAGLVKPAQSMEIDAGGGLETTKEIGNSVDPLVYGTLYDTPQSVSFSTPATSVVDSDEPGFSVQKERKRPYTSFYIEINSRSKKIRHTIGEGNDESEWG